jgi:SAM-dependent methyltransferase
MTEELNKHQNSRLFPSRFNSFYYVLSQMREALKLIKHNYLGSEKVLKLIDYGCGSKPYKSLFEDCVEQYIGIDFEGNSLADVHISEDAKTNLSDNYADVILSTQVLEHVDNPQEYLIECHRLLKAGGLLILSTHGYWVYHPIPVDYWRWTSTGLQKIIKQAGFKIEYSIGIMGVLPTSVQLGQDILITRIREPFRSLLVFILQFLISILDKLHTEQSKSRDACVYFIVARSIS